MNRFIFLIMTMLCFFAILIFSKNIYFNYIFVIIGISIFPLLFAYISESAKNNKEKNFLKKISEWFCDFK